MASKAYVIKKCGVIGEGASGSRDGIGAVAKNAQVSWSKNGGPLESWKTAKTRANFI